MSERAPRRIKRHANLAGSITTEEKNKVEVSYRCAVPGWGLISLPLQKTNILVSPTRNRPVLSCPVVSRRCASSDLTCTHIPSKVPQRGLVWPSNSVHHFSLSSTRPKSSHRAVVASESESSIMLSCNYFGEGRYVHEWAARLLRSLRPALKSDWKPRESRRRMPPWTGAFDHVGMDPRNRSCVWLQYFCRRCRCVRRLPLLRLGAPPPGRSTGKASSAKRSSYRGWPGNGPPSPCRRRCRGQSCGPER